MSSSLHYNEVDHCIRITFIFMIIYAASFTLLIGFVVWHLYHEKIPCNTSSFVYPRVNILAEMQRTSTNTDNIAVKYIYGPKTVTYRNEKHSINVSVFVPKNVTLRQFEWSQDEVEVQRHCDHENYGILNVPPIVEAITKEMLFEVESPFVGGAYTPSGCTPRDRTAIIVPYRNREQNLYIFVSYMQHYLQLQGIDYAIYIIEQMDSKPFNRAKLFNVGYVMAQLMHNYSCVILHDIDLLPENTEHSYTCNKTRPVHMLGKIRTSLIRSARMWAVSILCKDQVLATTTEYIDGKTYNGHFDGVNAFTSDQYSSINGMTNTFWGGGVENDEVYWRLKIKSLEPYYVDVAQATNIGQYISLDHSTDPEHNRPVAPREEMVKKLMTTDGLSTLDFEIVDIIYKPWYTHISVSLA